MNTNSIRIAAALAILGTAACTAPSPPSKPSPSVSVALPARIDLGHKGARAYCEPGGRSVTVFPGAVAITNGRVLDEHRNAATPVVFAPEAVVVFEDGTRVTLPECQEVAR
ncbi:hypothetical protein EDD41_2734 [Luteococcus japonicus]|uniref:Lipoprotein n=1 Tax=Luteococcus japonicus TaxID=33984 RepID=A0A3N1ZX83_9ACTN|nr:hypothetical protein [Luteococcus japonicus]ROR55460.1 hypothetical protein EDD41_2734 [Luteococcus japonicus]